MIKQVIFDFAGVITDLTWEGAVASFTKIGLKNAEQILDRYHQSGIFQELEEGKIDTETFGKKLSEMCGRDLFKRKSKRNQPSWKLCSNSRKQC